MLRTAANKLMDLFKGFSSNAGLKNYVSNAGWMFASRVLSMVVAFFATAFVVRRLGPESYGQLSYAISFIGLFSVFASLGIDNVLYRDIISFKEKKEIYLGTAFRIKLISAACTTLVTCLVAYFFSEHDVSLYLIMLVSGTYIFNSFNVISYEFQADVNSKKVSIVTFIAGFVTNLIKIAVCVTGKGVLYLAVALLFEASFTAGAYVFLRRKYYGSMKNWSFDNKVAKAMINAAWPLLFSNAFVIIYSRIDQVMIKNMLDAASVGLYDAAARISELWYFLPAILVSTFFPAIINAKSVSDELYVKRMSHMLRLLFAISIFFALPVTLLAAPIISLIYGKAFLAAVPILKIYVWGGIGISMSYFIHVILLAEHKQKTSLVISMISMFLNVGLNFIFIPRYGINGAAWATFVSYFANFFSLLFFKSTRPIFWSLFNSQGRLEPVVATSAASNASTIASTTAAVADVETSVPTTPADIDTKELQ